MEVTYNEGDKLTHFNEFVFMPKTVVIVGEEEGWQYIPRRTMWNPFSSGKWIWKGDPVIINPREKWQEYAGNWYLLYDYNKWKGATVHSRTWPDADLRTQHLMVMNSKTNKWEAITLNLDEIKKCKQDACLNDNMSREYCDMSAEDIILVKQPPKSPLESLNPARSGGKRRTKRQRKHKKRSIKRRN